MLLKFKEQKRKPYIKIFYSSAFPFELYVEEKMLMATFKKFNVFSSFSKKLKYYRCFFTTDFGKQDIKSKACMNLFLQ